MSRTVNGERWFGPAEKEWLRQCIRRVADFSGVRLITYAVMDNHIHLLVEVPPEVTIPDAELVRRYRILYPKSTPWNPVDADALADLLEKNGPEGQRLRARLLRRMHDPSWLMKTVKQRFATWFNARNNRFGPVWAERFKAVLVEGDTRSLRTVAAYIDLNPVRSGAVDDPKDYRFCGYGEAVGGGKAARAGLAALDRDLRGYRQTLFGSGSAAKEGKAAFDRATAVRVLEKEKGRLPLAEVLRCRVRYLTDGYVLGSSDFVAGIAESLNATRKRPAKPHPLEGADWGDLAVFAGLRKDRFG